MSIFPLNLDLIATAIVKLHHGRNRHPFHLVVTDEIEVLNHAEVKQFRNERVEKWFMMVKNVVYDGKEHKNFCLSKKGRSNTISCHSPSSTLPLSFDITSDSFVLNVDPLCKPHLIASPIVILHQG